MPGFNGAKPIRGIPFAATQALRRAQRAAWREAVIDEGRHDMLLARSVEASSASHAGASHAVAHDGQSLAIRPENEEAGDGTAELHRDRHGQGHGHGHGHQATLSSMVRDALKVSRRQRKAEREARGPLRLAVMPGTLRPHAAVLVARARAEARFEALAACRASAAGLEDSMPDPPAWALVTHG